MLEVRNSSEVWVRIVGSVRSKEHFVKTIFLGAVNPKKDIFNISKNVSYNHYSLSLKCGLRCLRNFFTTSPKVAEDKLISSDVFSNRIHRNVHREM